MRYTPVRPKTKKRWIMPEALSRELVRYVKRARARAKELAGSDVDALAQRFVRLRGNAQKGGITSVLDESLALSLCACDELVGPRWDLRPRDNQLACAAALALGKVAELDTGEGKTLAVALAAASLSCLGRVHVVTANDYLAGRDASWMRPLFDALGVTVGLVSTGMDDPRRREAYLRDVTYVSVKELGADYLRDTLSSDLNKLFLPGLETALLDEVDFILVDEARVPLILAEQVQPEENLCHQFNDTVLGLVMDQKARLQKLRDELGQIEHTDWPEKKRRFERSVRHAKLWLADPLDDGWASDGDMVRRAKATIRRFEKTKRKEELLSGLFYAVDRKSASVELTEQGLDRLAEIFGELFVEPDPQADPEVQKAQRARLRAVHNLLAAHVLHRRDRDYIVDDGSVVLVDSATGRPSFDRRLQHGLHRAIEAKEGLYPALDHRTAAEITFPALFALYDRWAGTSGTCLELEGALRKSHKKRVVRIAPHRPVIRADFEDALFDTFNDKLVALIAEAALAQAFGQPLLVGTDSVEVSERVSEALCAHHIDHVVLNARHHKLEAQIIAGAGQPGVVTVATAMAGRGTDIRPAKGLAHHIASQVACWARRQKSLGARGFRLEVFSAYERDILAEELKGQEVPFRFFRDRQRGAVFDIGTPPPTAMPITLGLRVIGFERQSASRLDRQLRGRCGRQGGPGSSRFYVALDDETVLVYGDRVSIAKLRGKARKRLDALSHHPVRAHRGLKGKVESAWTALEVAREKQLERLGKLDRVDQQQRRHYDNERWQLLRCADQGMIPITDHAINRAAVELVDEVAAGQEKLPLQAEHILDNLTQVLFERRGLFRPIFRAEQLPDVALARQHLSHTLLELYAVARASHGPEVMSKVERTVLLDSLTEVWRLFSAERPELRQQAELYAYAGRKPDQVYRHMAGQAYHEALKGANRSAASVLVTFPLPREIKTPRTGVTIGNDHLRALTNG